MSQLPVTPTGSISIAEKVQVIADMEAEAIDWDHAVARFLLATVRKKSLTATVAPLAAPSDDFPKIAARSPLFASPTN
jgi:hypothetical protein